MNLTVKTVATVTCLLLLFIIGTSYASINIILRGFKSLEEDRTILAAQRVIEAFEVEKENLATKVSDWATWDDSYQYIQDKNEDYEIANLQPLALDNLKLNMMLFIDLQGSVVAANGYNLQTQLPNPVPESVLASFGANSPLLSTHNTDYKSGLIDTPEGPLFFASRPILPTSGEGIPKGTIVFARYFDQEQITRLASVTKSNLTGFYSTDPVPADFDKERHIKILNRDIFLTIRSEEEIAADFHIHTIDNKPGIFFRLTTQRDIYALGKQTGMYITTVLLILGIVAVLTITILLKKLVLTPLTTIQKEVQRIQTAGNPSERLSTTGLHGEFSYLCHDVNSMLAALEEKTQEMQKMNSLMVGRELRMQELKQKNADLEKSLTSKV